ncbi:beta-lactamase family protein (plasmid) [Embleya sp. NBC_00888]|uniref:serine hydrolase domain-containing protein n=1 Tax=Embleya sp. NBC_00888 TaxID=2975960 RepID=UPI002F90C17D|nr:beta-lactamase family protein [Embleya sp. NBC_00888]
MHDRAQNDVRGLLDELVESGREIGIRVAAYLDGELVVDAWAGWADRARTEPVDGRTLFPVFSVSKGILACLTHVLVDRGVLTYDTRVADLWPEFGAHGKAAITLAQVLEHSAGVPYFPRGLSPDDLLDRERIAGLIADTEPVWPPGTRTGYHSLTFGYLIGETLERATGRPLEDLVRDELAVPLGLDGELYVVPPLAQAARLADVEATDIAACMAAVPADNPFARAVGGIPVESIVPRRTVPPGRSWSTEAPLPFAATMTARAGARLYAAFAGGGEVDGVRLLRRASLEAATTIRRRDVDEVAGVPALKSLGYLHADPVSGEREAAFGFGGLGGAEAYADPEHRFSFAFTHNRLTPPTESDNAPAIAARIRAALGIE